MTNNHHSIDCKKKINVKDKQEYTGGTYIECNAEINEFIAFVKMEVKFQQFFNRVDIYVSVDRGKSMRLDEYHLVVYKRLLLVHSWWLVMNLTIKKISFY